MKNKSKDKLSEEQDTKTENLTDENINQTDVQDESADELKGIEEEDMEVQEKDGAIEKLEAELTESKDKYLRLYSEFENFRRRTSREKLDLIETAAENLMTALLPVIDDFERAGKSLNGEESDVKSIREGMDLIQNKLIKTLEQKGLKPMNSKIGQDFDPDFHEAITQIPAPEDKLKGKIVDVIEKGYLLKDKVIRYAKVVTGS